jgi:hypothetical protein
MKEHTPLKVLRRDLWRFKAEALKRRMTMIALFSQVCDMLEAQDDVPAKKETEQ